ncbi:MAG: MinD/ParA family protein, partial [Corynebacterium variabile]
MTGGILNGNMSGNVSDALDSQALVGAVDAAPPDGWRRVLHRLSRGRVNPGESQRQIEARELQ